MPPVCVHAAGIAATMPPAVNMATTMPPRRAGAGDGSGRVTFTAHDKPDRVTFTAHLLYMINVTGSHLLYIHCA